MHYKGHRKHAWGEHTQLFCKLRSQPVEIEHEPFVHPILDEKNHKVAQVKERHAWRESESNEYSEQDLSIPNF